MSRLALYHCFLDLQKALGWFTSVSTIFSHYLCGQIDLALHFNFCFLKFFQERGWSGLPLLLVAKLNDKCFIFCSRVLPQRFQSELAFLLNSCHVAYRLFFGDLVMDSASSWQFRWSYGLPPEKLQCGCKRSYSWPLNKHFCRFWRPHSCPPKLCLNVFAIFSYFSYHF